MSEALPSRVDAFRLAGRGAQIQNRTPVAAMSRLAELLADCDGSVGSELAFMRDAANHYVIEGRATATLNVLCQRCLRTLPVDVDTRIRLGLVGDDAEAERLPEGMEPVLSDDGQVSPLALVEDELILALPIVALHENCTAPIDAVPGPAKDDSNPFAVLEKLKNRQR